MSLPNSYNRLEYIQSSGTQYINLGSVVNTNLNLLKFEADCQFTDITSSSASAGKILGSGGNGSYLWAGLNGGYFTMQSGGSGTEINLQSADTNRHIWVLDQVNKKFAIDINEQSYNATLSNTGCNFYIFARCQNGAIQRQAAMKMYSFNIYISGTLSYELIPAQRKSDDVVGMYDLTHNIFYTNSGTGSFTAGPVIVTAVNKVIYENNTLIDLTGVTVDANYLQSGYTAHKSNGAIITGIIPKAIPIEITTEAAMANVLTSSNIGKCYKYVGTLSSTYITNDLYVVEEVH